MFQLTHRATGLVNGFDVTDPILHMLPRRSGALVAHCEGDLVYYALGTGEYDELTRMLSALLRSYWFMH